MRRTAGRAALVAGCAVLASGCVGLASEEDRTRARERWDAVPPAVLSALQAGEEDEAVYGPALETVEVSAPLGLPGLRAPGRPGVLGDDLAARCRALVVALRPTRVRAAGLLPLHEGPVVATEETCDRGLGHGGLTAGGLPATGSGVLRLVDAGGRPVQGTVRLRREGRPELAVTSDEPEAAPAPVELDLAAHDAALARALVPLPLVHPGASPAPEGGSTHYLLGVPSGTRLVATAQCGTPTTDRSLSLEPSSLPSDEVVARVSFFGSRDPEPSGPRDPGCEDGPVTGPLTPALRFTPTAGPSRGRELDVVALLVSERAADDGRPRDRVRVEVAD